MGRRSDGYHELESLFLPIDLEDGLELELEPGGASRVSLRLDGAAEGVPSDSRNLAVRAAERFLEAAERSGAVRIRLTKRIPAGAGLGGGSSDAAAVLRGLAQACPGALEEAALRRLALELGADVPFFLDPRPALVTGVGERCEALAGPWPGWILLLAHPGVALSTARVFEAFDGSGRSRCTPALRRLLGPVRAAPADASALAALLENDLEPAARSLCPALPGLREALRRAGALAVGMSGSGATLFGVFASQEAAEAARRRLPAGGWSRVARTAESR